jgi:hypothetical protein
MSVALCMALTTWADGFSARNDEMQGDLAAFAAEGLLTSLGFAA